MITRTPMNPKMTAPIRVGVRRSPRKMAASSAVQAGMVSSSANTVASGSKVSLVAQAICEAKCTLLRARCRPMCRLLTARMRSGRARPIASRMTTPIALRSARISRMPSTCDNSRIETAIAEKDSRVPVIHSTTGISWAGVTRGRRGAEGRGTKGVARMERSGMRDRDPGLRFAPSGLRSLGIRLVFRPRLVEGGEPETGGLDREDFGEPIERYIEAAGIVDLWHEADVGKADMRTERVGAREEQRFGRLESDRHPMRIPGIDGVLVLLERVLQIEQRADIVERMDVAGDHLGERAHMGTFDRVCRQQRRLGMDLVEILDDGQRLDQHVAARKRHCRHAALRIEGAELGRVLSAAALGEMDRLHFIGETLEVERDPRPVGGRRPEIRVELHETSWLGEQRTA